jgi:membrane-bound metal-dependent hydrolase YbcI (DUF457 family)
MAQAGMHGLISFPVRKWAPERELLMLGIVLGSLLPDSDNLAVAVATLTQNSTEGLHRTFTHSLFTVVGVIAFFFLIGAAAKLPRLKNLGIGLGLGILMHILLDLLIWFDGVAILWPIPYYLNFWSNVTPPELWMKLMYPAELLFFALFFFSLDSMARKQGSDLRFLGKLRIWTVLEGLLFLVFLVLVFTLSKGFMTIFGAVYLLSLGLAIGIAIRMRTTIEGPYKAASTEPSSSKLSLA